MALAQLLSMANDAKRINRRDCLKATGLVGAISLTGCIGDSENNGGNGSNDNVELRVAGHYPDGHYIPENSIVPIMDQTKEQFNGNLTFDRYPGEQLGEAEDLLRLLNNQSTDIADIIPAYFGSKLYLTTVGDLPATFDTSEQGAKAIWELANGGIIDQNEYQPRGLKPLIVAPLQKYQVLTKETKIESVSDFNGLSLRASGGSQAQSLRQVDANPVTDLPAPDIHSAMQRGSIDGALMNPGSIKPYSLHEVSDYMTSNTHFGTTTISYMMNLEVYNSLSEDLQNIFTDVCNSVTPEFGRAMDEDFDETLTWLGEQDMEIYDVPESTLTQISEATQPVPESWIDDGPDDKPKQDTYDAYEQALENV